jgi:trehalose 6-phosphate synthase/phosphatase
VLLDEAAAYIAIIAIAESWEPESGGSVSRLLLVSNRLPLTAERKRGKLTLTPSAGGLATGLHSVHDPGTGLWFGWSGLFDRPAGYVPETDEWARRGCVPVPLTRTEIRDYYEAFGNGVVWPLFHSLIDRMPLRPRGWAVYDRVNQRFADAVLAELRPDDVVWVHDYQLMRVPAQIRADAPHARIGFFLHIPFPSVEIFSALPGRERVLEGLLGADLIGFHTAGYLRNFADAVERLLGLPVHRDVVVHGGREVRLGVFPMGADIARYADPAPSRSRSPRPPLDRRLLLGVDRLDYTKGIPRRLLSFEQLLETHHELRGRVCLLQIAVPSRTDVPAYRRFRRQIDGLVGRINGAYGTSAWTPVQYMARPVSREQLVGLYRSCDVMVVTPVRDGMNLVAKEFVASRVDEDGVLVLSEFAGAADELHESLLVNPYDIEHVAETLHDALLMPPDERRARMRSMRQRVLRADAAWWARSFLAALRGSGAHHTAPHERRTRTVLDAAVRQIVVRAAASAPHRLLLLDYDGTLTALAPTPRLAAPDRSLLSLLRTLAEQPGTSVHITSGRDRATLDAWLGALPVALHAEHGLWSRASAGAEWTRADVAVALPREDDILALLEDAVRRIPGTLIERKSTGIAWHYRLADPALAGPEVRRLQSAISRLLDGESAEVHTGHRVLEVRPSGVDKGSAIVPALAALAPGTAIVAIGDDRTDEQLFAALPPDALTIHVGDGLTRARLRLGSVAEVRLLLADLTRGASGDQCPPFRASLTAAVSAGTISAASPTIP